jgi:hypothetical protein
LLPQTLGENFWAHPEESNLMKKTIVLLAFAVSISYSQETISYEEFIKRMPHLTSRDKEDYKSYPELRNLMWAVVKGMATRTLAKLGYGTGPFISDYGTKEKAAIEKFQSDLNLPVTGSLDSLTLRHLAEAEDFFFHTTVTLPTKSVWVDKQHGLAQATGTWRAVNYDDAFPFNTQHMSFSKSTMTCEGSSTIIQWERSGLLTSGRFVQIMPDVYTISRWDDDFIIAESQAICTKTVLTLNLKSEDVTLATYVTKTDGECQFLDKEPKFSTLVNGIELYSDKRWHKYQNILNKNSDAPRILREFEKLKDKYKDK